MREYKRNYPYFSLCGLACGLCPRYHTEGKSKCPGCGGTDFHLKHPTCAIITCNQKNDNVEFCFQCSKYPCSRYLAVNTKDSFITYQNVLNDFNTISRVGEEKFKEAMNLKIAILEKLLRDYNDGRKKNFYCIAVNLLSLDDLNEVMEKVEELKCDQKEKINEIVKLFHFYAKKKGISLSLRK